MGLLEFIEKKTKQADRNSQDACQQLCNKIDFENWTICKVIGRGAYAKVYLVYRRFTPPAAKMNKLLSDNALDNPFAKVRLEDLSQPAQKEQYYAMKVIKKTTVLA